MFLFDFTNEQRYNFLLDLFLKNVFLQDKYVVENKPNIQGFESCSFLELMMTNVINGKK